MNRSDHPSGNVAQDSWSEWFIQLESAPIINKSFKARLFETFNATLIDNECREQLLKYDEINFLFKMNFGQGKVDMIHHCQEVGGNS